LSSSDNERKVDFILRAGVPVLPPATRAAIKDIPRSELENESAFEFKYGQMELADTLRGIKAPGAWSYAAPLQYQSDSDGSFVHGHVVTCSVSQLPGRPNSGPVQRRLVLVKSKFEWRVDGITSGNDIDVQP